MKITKYDNYKELPRELIVQLTTSCNLRCSYCFQYKREIKNMSIETAYKCIDFMMSKDDGEMRIINFYGGEPTLNLDTMEALIDRYIYHKNRGNTSILYFYINTNGTIINERIINIFKKVMSVTCFRYCLSINGNKESQDKSRGINTFNLIMNNIKKLKKEIPNIFIEGHAVADREFIKNLKDNSIYMLTNNLFDEATSEPMFYGTSDEYTKEDFEKLVDVYNELLKEGYDYKKVFLLFEAFMEEENYKNICRGCPRLCIPGYEVVCVDTLGNFLPCDFYLNLDDYSKYIMGTLDDSETYNNKVNYYKKVKDDLTVTEKSCRSEYGTYCKEECNYSSECQVCNASAEIITGGRLIIPKGICDRTKLMCEVFINKKFNK